MTELKPRIRVTINGASGRMGKLAVETLGADPAFEVVARLGRQDDLRLALAQCKPDVVLDLTTAFVARANAELILETGHRAVIGTSGLDASDVAALSELARVRGLGALFVPNFSITAALMLRFSELAARYLPHVEIVELHHGQKLDSPSATSLATADAIAVARGFDAEVSPADSPARGLMHRGIHIHSVRLGGLGAHQEVLFSSDAELLTIRSDVFDRSAYQRGIALACREVMNVTGMHVGLAGLL
ncbi:MAG: dihydrodipicolinate reductase [Pseudomonadota bacterium]